MPNSPRGVLRLGLEILTNGTDAERAELGPPLRGAAWVAGCSAAVVDGWGSLGTEEPMDLGQLEISTRGFLGLDRKQPCKSCRRNGGPVGAPCETCGTEGKDHGKAASKALANAIRCKACSTVFRERGRPERRYLAPLRCNTRACPDCARRRLRRIIGGRWAPLFDAALKDGYVVDFFTIGNGLDVGHGVGIVSERDHVRDYLRRSGQALRAMMEGRKYAGIAAGDVVAGLRVLELVERKQGAFAHLHIILIRRAFVPYGLSAKRQSQLRAADPAWKPSPEQRGMREILRRRGLGEVGKHEVLSADDANASRNGIAPYLWKVQKYLEKVENGQARMPTQEGEDVQCPLLFGGRHDILKMLSGIRMVEPMGDARGLLGGPDRAVRELHGVRCETLERLGVFNPEEPATFDTLPEVLDASGRLLLMAGEVIDHGEELSITRRTTYRDDTLMKWARWCDLDKLLAGCITGERVRLTGKPRTGPGP